MALHGDERQKVPSRIFIAQLAEQLGEKAAVIGTLGVGRLGLRDTGHTTPAMVSLHRTLKELCDSGISLVAMEVSSCAGSGRVAGVRFAAAVLTNVTQDHLDYHGTMEVYSEAKRKLFNWPDLQVAVLNLDDAYGKRWASEPASGTMKTYGLNDAADLTAYPCTHTAGTRIQIGQGEQAVAELPLLGDFNVSNFLASMAVLEGMGWQRAEIPPMSQFYEVCQGAWRKSDFRVDQTLLSIMRIPQTPCRKH